MKKLIFVLVVIAALCVLVTTVGFGAKPEISFAWEETASVSYTNETPCIKWMGEATGSVVKPIPIPSDGYRAKLQAFLASGDVPDIVYIGSNLDYLKEWGGDRFLPLDEYLNKMPNVKKIFDKYPEARKVCRGNDGKLYGLPTLSGVTAENPLTYNNLAIQGAWLAELGLTPDKIETLDDLMNVLVKFKEKHGGYPWGGRFGFSWGVSPYLNWFGTGNEIYWNFIDKKWKFGPLDEGYRTFVDFFSKAWAKGLIHPEAFTMDDEFHAIANRGGWGFVMYGFPEQYNAAPGKVNSFVPMLPPKVGGRRYPVGSTSAPVDRTVWAISAKARNLDAVLGLVNWLWSAAGTETVTLGKEGETFRRNPDGTSDWLCSIWGFNPGKKSWADYGLWGMAGAGGPVKTWEMATFRWVAPNRAEWVRFYDNAKLINPPDLPVPTFTDAEYRLLRRVWTPIQTYASENLVLFMTGKKPMSEWSQFTKAIVDMGIEDVLEMYNVAHQRDK